MSEIRNRAVARIDGKSMEELAKDFLHVKNKIEEVRNGSDNNQKRTLYADCELLVIHLEGLVKNISTNENDKGKLSEMIEELKSMSSTLSLSYISRQHTNVFQKTFSLIDEVIRLFTAWFFLIVTSTFIALPAIFIRYLDYLLVRWNIIQPHYQISMLCKRFIAYGCIKLYGIEMITQNYNPAQFGKDCCLVCYSHSSTLDAFLFTAAIPVRHYSLAKADLFLIPFFSWCLVSFGGVPIDRSNREQAINAIQAAISSAQAGDCLAIAPEGTRSLSGQILPFKKGTFYMWEQLQTPIVPLVFFGAYDLFSTKRNVPVSGKVFVRYLDPIYPHEAASREEMSALVRTKMLQAWKDSPIDTGAPLSWKARVEQLFITALFYGLLYGMYKYVPLSSFLHHHSISTFQFYGGLVGFCIIITLLFYVYLMYIDNWLSILMKYLCPQEQRSKSK